MLSEWNVCPIVPDRETKNPQLIKAKKSKSVILVSVTVYKTDKIIFQYKTPQTKCVRLFVAVLNTRMKLFKLGKDFYFSFCPKIAGSMAEELGRGKTPYFLAEKTTGRGQNQSTSSRLASRAEPPLCNILPQNGLFKF